MAGKVYKFRISEGFTPKTLPLSRLAEYLDALGNLLGEKDHVHFRSLKAGSTQIEAVVDDPAFPKVKDRVGTAARRDAPRELIRARQKLNGLLARDNAKGRLNFKEGDKRSQVVLLFPGKDAPQPVDVSEIGSIQGQLIRVGGLSQGRATAEIALQESETVTVLLAPELAKKMAPDLYGWVHLSGRGRWRRNIEEEWEFVSFRVTDFEVLKEETLAVTFKSLQSIEDSGWSEVEDPYTELERLRHNEE